MYKAVSVKDEAGLRTEKSDLSSQILFYIRPFLPHEQMYLKVLVFVFSQSAYKALAFIN